MIYAMSDLHGRYDLYLKMLDKISFSENDSLYILGDFVDRGEAGLRLLFDVFSRKNVYPIMGNHDMTALNCMTEIYLDPDSRHRPSLKPRFDFWFRNGGVTTFNEFLTLNSPKQRILLERMVDMPAFADITVGDRRFTMCHSGMANYTPDRPLEDYDLSELAYKREDYSRPKFNEPNRYLVCGHTPTLNIEGGERGRILRTHDIFAIDCGAVFDFGLGCLCLDTLDEFYVI